MIKRLEVQNFQSHEHSKVELAQCTIFTGPSSSGKTSMAQRALEWLFYGEWDNTYPMDDTKPTAVAIEMDDGTKVMRMRKKDENLAAVIKNGETFKYKAFGNTIPGIFDIINMRPIKMNGKEINLNMSIQDQPPFLLSDSRPARAQWLGRLYGAHVINAMLREMNSDKRDKDKRTREADVDITDLKDRLTGFESLKDQRWYLQKAQETMSKVENLIYIQKLMKSVIDLDVQIEGSRWLSSFDLRALRRDVRGLQELRDLREGLIDLKSSRKALDVGRCLLKTDISSIRNDIRQLKVLRQLDGEQKELQSSAKTLKKGLWLLRVDLDDLRDPVNKVIALKGIAVSLKNWEMKDGDWADSYCKVEADLKDLRDDFKKHVYKGGKCPLCASKKKIPAETIAKNLRQLVGGS